MGKKMFSIAAVVLTTTVALTACTATTADSTNTAAPTTVTATVDGGREAMGGGSRGVVVANNTGKDVTLTITGTDNYDWENARPDRPAPYGFQGVTISSGDTLLRSLDKNSFASGAPFTINFSNGARVELNTKTSYEADDVVEELNDWSGWGLRTDDDGCQTDTIQSNGYTIVVECREPSVGAGIVTISK
jgi:hypothetical protein